MVMTEIVRELTTIPKTNGSTSEQVLSGARRVRMQRAQKVILDATKESKGFDTTKK